MTIDKNGDAIIIRCDYCPKSTEIESPNSETAISLLISIGWSFQKDHNDCLENVCSVCARIPGVLKTSLIGDFK